MLSWIITKLELDMDNSCDIEYLDCVSDLIDHELVKSMKDYSHHKNVDCLEHSLSVSYHSYLLCRRFGLDYRSAARGGLLHDFFLYDWHVQKTIKGVHGFKHPKTALHNATKHFQLNRREKDVIAKHMWPLTILLPRFRESWIIVGVDKYCALMETFDFGKRPNIRRLQKMLSH